MTEATVEVISHTSHIETMESMTNYMLWILLPFWVMLLEYWSYSDKSLISGKWITWMFFYNVHLWQLIQGHWHIVRAQNIYIIFLKREVISLWILVLPRICKPYSSLLALLAVSCKIKQDWKCAVIQSTNLHNTFLKNCFDLSVSCVPLSAQHFPPQKGMGHLPLRKETRNKFLPLYFVNNCIHATRNRRKYPSYECFGRKKIEKHKIT